MEYAENSELSGVGKVDCVKMTYATGDVFTQYSDKRGNIVRTMHGNQTLTETDYAADGRILSYYDNPVEITEEYGYDDRKALVSFLRSRGSTSYSETYEYNKYGDLQTLTQKRNGEQLQRYTYT